MAVPVPASAAVITPASVTDMHAAVRTLINSVGPTQFTRGSITHQATSQGLVVGSDYKPLYGSATLNVEPVAFLETPGFILASWQDLGAGGAYDYFLNNAGAGYVLGPCILVTWCCFRVANQSAENLFAAYAFNLGRRENGVDIVNDGATRIIRVDDHAGDPLQAHDINYDVTILYVVDHSGSNPFTLNEIRLRGAKVGVNGMPTTNAVLSQGNVGFIAFKPQ